MFNWVITLCCFGFALANIEEFQLQYVIGADGELANLSVKVDLYRQIVNYHMIGQGNFEDVETIENYILGIAASRVESQEACYVRRLVRTLGEQIAYLQQHENKPMIVDEDFKVSTIVMENPEEEVGSQMNSFCSDLTVYKMVKEEDETAEDTEEVPQERQVSVTFTRCVLVVLVPVCFNTCLTVPTGATITYVWFWFG